MRKTWLLLINLIALVSLFVSLSSAQSRATGYPIPFGEFDYTANGGYMNVSRNSQHFSDMGFAFVFNVGINKFYFNPESFNWNVNNLSGGRTNVTNNNAAFPLTASYILNNRSLKVSHTLRNNFGILSNVEFWYYLRVDGDKKFVWNGTQYNSNEFIDIQANLSGILPQISFYEGFTWDYSDLIDTNFTANRFYIGNGSVINTSDPIIIGLSFRPPRTLGVGSSIVLDPTAISGCTETSTTITCASGTFTGNTLHTTKNISISGAYLPGEVDGSGNNEITLNSSGGWINISSSTIESNATALSASTSTLTIRNAPQGLNIFNSVVQAVTNDDGNLGGGAGTVTINVNGEFNLTTSTIRAKGRITTTSSCGGCAGGGSSLTILSSRINVLGGLSHLISRAGDVIGSGGSSNLDGGGANIQIRGNWTTSSNSDLNISVTGGDSSGTGARNGGSATFQSFSPNLNINTTIEVIGGDGATGEGDVTIEFLNNTVSDITLNLKDGFLSTSGTPSGSVETVRISARDIILENFDFINNWETGSYLNLTNDIAKLALYNGSSFSNAISSFTYRGVFGIILVGEDTTNLELGSLSYENRTLGNIHAPLTNLTSPINSSIVAITRNFQAQTITNYTLQNATLYIWNSTGSLINSSNSQTLSGQNFSILIPHSFTQGTDINNNYTWNILVTDSDNRRAFQGRHNLTISVDFEFPNVSISNIVTTPGSQTITFNISAQGQQGCFYSIYTASGVVSGLNNNVTVSCGVRTSATVGDFGTFRLFGYANDTVNNVNQTSQNLTLESLAGGPSGASTSAGIKIIGKTVNWTIRTENRQSKYDLLMNKGSNRTKGLQFINDAPSQVQIQLSCLGSYCPLISFEKTEFSLPSSSVNKVTEVDFNIGVPEEIDVKDFTIIVKAVDQEGNIAELPVDVTISPLGALSEFFDKLFLVKRIVGLDIPLLVIALFGASVIFGAFYFGVLRVVKVKGTRGFISIFPSILSFILIIIFIR